MADSMNSILSHHISAGYPIIAVETVEERRFLSVMTRESYKPNAELDNTLSSKKQPYNVLLITAMNTLMTVKTDLDGDLQIAALATPPKADGHPLTVAFGLAAKNRRTLMVVFDARDILKQPIFTRALLNQCEGLKAVGSVVILVSDSWLGMPTILEKNSWRVALPLASRDELEVALDVVVDGTAPIADDARKHMLDAAAGLPLQQAENAFALSWIKSNGHDPSVVADIKMDMVRASGLLKIAKPSDPKNIGGLGQFRDYVTEEVVPTYGTRRGIKRLMLTGVQGGGKSLSAKALAADLGVPLIYLEFSSLKDSLVGGSEKNVAKALATINAVENCVLWIDELDDAFGDAESSARTGSTTGAMVGMMATWMEENQPDGCLVICTCNDFSKIPLKIVRRFDEIFFVDLPTKDERLKIARVHLRLNEVADPKDLLAQVCVEVSDGWNGDEIRKCIVSAWRRARKNPDGKVNAGDIYRSAAAIKPISVTRAGEIAAMRKWGLNDLRLANTPEKAEKGKRQIASLEVNE